MATSTADLRLNSTPAQGPSVDEWILGLLEKKGAQTLDQLADSLPEVNWAQFFLAIDRLRRSGKVMLWHRQPGDYLISLHEREATAEVPLAS
jgi:hypothetical protein